MINHPEPIDTAMLKAIEDGKQSQIYRYVELPNQDKSLANSRLAHHVHIALIRNGAYRKANDITLVLGGEKKK